MAGVERGNVEGRLIGHRDPSHLAGQTEPVILAGRYELGPLLGVGGMGLVYEASDLVTGNPVAYKTLRSEAALEPRIRQLFAREQEALRRLNHPNVVQIVDLIDGDDGFGIIMEYFPAGNLRDVLGDRQLDLPAKVRVAAGIASGLAAIHAQGIVHRDLKPPNVLVVEISGMWVPKISDLGVARFVSESLVGSTNVIGTPTYMAPESTDPGGQQASADVYALGIMLFELLVGHVPYEGESPLGVLKAHADQPTPLVQGVAEPLSVLLLDLLAKNPANRPTAAEAEQRLIAVLPEVRADMVPTVAPPPPPPYPGHQPPPGYGQPPRGFSPGYSQPPQGFSPAYSQPPQGFSPAYSQPPQGFSPGYGQQPHGFSPGYAQPPQGFSPGYDPQPLQGFSPGFGQPPQGFPPLGQPPAQGHPPPDLFAQPVHRYGSQGQPFSPQDRPGHGRAGLSIWVKVIAYIVSGLKLIPMAILFAATLFVDSFLNDPNDTTDLSRASLIAVALAGSAPLLVQIVAVAKNNRTLVIVFAAILAVLDVLLLLASLAVGDIASGSLVVAVGAAQVAVLVGAIQANS